MGSAARSVVFAELVEGMNFISFSDVSFAYAGKPVLANISFRVAAGERLAVLGPNGAGKSTLLALATGQLQPDAGQVQVPAAALPVFAAGAPATVGAALATATAHVQQLLQEFTAAAAQVADADAAVAAAAADAYAALLNRLSAADAWDLAARQEQLLEELGLSGVELARPLAELSPGQVERLRLVCLLLAGPAALVLDEPTNHLDAAGQRFLVELVCAFPGPVLFASHDREFIEQCATGILDLDTTPWEAVAQAGGGEAAGCLRGGVQRCAGRYSDYLVAKEQARQAHVRLHAAQQREKAQLVAHQRESAVVGHRDFQLRSEAKISKKFYADRAQAVSTRRINADAVRLERLAAAEVRRPRYAQQRLVLPPPAAAGDAAGSIVLRVRDAAVPGRLAACSVEVAAGEKLLLTGPNGCGKSTLLRWLATGCAPAGARGEAWLADGVFVSQELPALAELARLCGQEEAAQLWAGGVGELGKGFLHPQYWRVPLPELSAGNQRRALLAVAFAARPAVVLLDEPTNYLDVDTLEQLEAELLAWPGTLVLATHDVWLRRKWQQLVDAGTPGLRQLTLQAV